MAVPQGVADELICSICLELFQCPVILPCAHTFCKQCLVNVQERRRFRRSFRNYTSGGGGSNSGFTGSGGNTALADNTQETPGNKLICPHCRAEVQLGPAGIDGLPRNTTLANIILSLEEDKRDTHVVCEVCDDDPPRAAAKICSDCYVTYCLTCFRELHPMRGSFKYHVIKETNQTTPATLTRCITPILERPSVSGRFTPIGDFTDNESGDEGGSVLHHDSLDRIRRQVKTKRKELSSAMKNIQAMLKSTEEDTEERMREVRSVCSDITECVGEREAAMLTEISEQRHETRRQCNNLTGEVKGCTGRLDLLEEQVNDVTSVTNVYAGSDITNDIESLKTKLSEIQTKTLISKSKTIPRQPRLAENFVCQHVQALGFVKDVALATPEFIAFDHLPVSKGPAHVTVRWSLLPGVTKYKLTASRKDNTGNTIRIGVDLGPSSSSYQMALTHLDTEHVISLEAVSREGSHPIISETTKTLPYVHSLKTRFDPTSCHKKIAVSLSKDEIVHRKCKLASLHNACVTTTSSQRMDTLEGATADECLPIKPHVYWQDVIHFHVFGKLVDSRLLCDIGICKQGCEDSFTPLCDNSNSYATYLVKRNNKICLEFWNGTKRENTSRSIPVLDLDTDKEKTIKLGFYYNAIRKTFAVVSPANNTVLCRFHVKFVTVLPVYALYSTDQVFVMIRSAEAVKLPQVLSTLIRDG